MAEIMTKNTPWEGHTGAQVESFIKGTLEKRIGVIYYDKLSNKYLCFADEDNKFAYLNNMAGNAHLLLASFEAGGGSTSGGTNGTMTITGPDGLTEGDIADYDTPGFNANWEIGGGAGKDKIDAVTGSLTTDKSVGKDRTIVIVATSNGSVSTKEVKVFARQSDITIVAEPKNPICGNSALLWVEASELVNLDDYATPYVWNIVEGKLEGDILNTGHYPRAAQLWPSATPPEANKDRDITINVSLTPKDISSGLPNLTAQKVLSLRQAKYATTGAIDTYGKLGITENTTYDLIINGGEGTNADYSVVWELTGDGFSNGHVSLGSRDKNQCEVVVNSVPDPWQNFTLIATVTSGGKSFTVQTSGTFVGTFEGYKRSIYRIIINQTYPEVTITEESASDRSQIEAIRNGSHRYLGKNTAENTMTICQLDDSDSTKYASGGSASLTGGTNYEGDVFMKLPPFWYYVYRPSNAGSNDIWHIDFAADGDAPAPTFKRWDGNDLIGVYKASNPHGVNAIYSLSGYVPANSIADFPAYARQRGAGYSLVKWEHHCMMAALSYAWYKTVDLVAVCGSGKDGSVNADGLTNDLGMTDTTSADSGQRLNIWGLEDWWNSRNEEIDNIKMKTTANEVIFEITDDDGVRTVTTPRGENSTNIIYKLVLDNSLDMLPTEVGTDCNLGYKQTLARGATTTDTAKGVYRSGYNPAQSGPLRLMHKFNSSSTDSSRLAFRGTIVEEKNPATFKALTAINR